MLTPDQETFLRWLNTQPDGWTLGGMRQNQPPGFSENILNYLCSQKIGYIRRNHDTYTVSEAGKVALLELQQGRDDRAQRHAEKRQALRNQIISAILGSALTLIVEHFDDIAAYIGQLFDFLRSP